MKKIILSLAVIFVMSSFTISNTNEIVSPPEYTFEECDGFATVMGDILDLTYEEEHELFSACMDE